MSIFSKKSKNETSGYEDSYDNGYYANDTEDFPNESAFNSAENDAPNIDDAPAPRRSVSSYQSSGMSSGSAFAMKLIKPTSYQEAPAIADFLINRCAVVLNLEAANKETASNLIYFLTGVSYALGGQIKRVAANTYMLAPENMEISEEGRRAEADATAATDNFPG
mgnify:CR=1 FL=1